MKVICPETLKKGHFLIRLDVFLYFGHVIHHFHNTFTHKIKMVYEKKKWYILND